MIAHSIAPLTEDSVSLVKLSSTEWRVSDPRISEHDAESLLGFIEARGRVFEVTVLSRGVESFTALSLDAALSLFESQMDSRHTSPNVGGSTRAAAQQ